MEEDKSKPSGLTREDKEWIMGRALCEWLSWR